MGLLPNSQRSAATLKQLYAPFQCIGKSRLRQGRSLTIQLRKQLCDLSDCIIFLPLRQQTAETLWQAPKIAIAAAPERCKLREGNALTEMQARIATSTRAE